MPVALIFLGMLVVVGVGLFLALRLVALPRQRAWERARRQAVAHPRVMRIYAGMAGLGVIFSVIIVVGELFHGQHGGAVRDGAALGAWLWGSASLLTVIRDDSPDVPRGFLWRPWQRHGRRS